MKKVAIIMAGGKGTRLWPISKENLPKQFLPLLTKETMLELTIKRAMQIVEAQDIYIVTQPEYVEITKKQSLQVPSSNILAGLKLKSTTEAIAYATAIIKEKYEDAIMIVLPSDHVIQNEKLVESINKATMVAERDCIVTLGIFPEYPDTNYGYIQKGKLEEEKVYKVNKFKEKPQYELAKQYVDDQNHLWNSGIFIWKATAICQEFQKFMPDIYLEMNKLSKDLNTKEIDEIFKNVTTKSIDYDILEKTDNIYVVECNFNWLDIGNFSSLRKARNKDKNNNIIEGKVTSTKSKNNMIISNSKEIVAIGIENLIVVETDNEILIMNTLNSTDNDLKQILKQ